jgi:hypothetical protein
VSAFINRYSTRSLAIRLFLTCWLVYCLHFATNTVREIYPALSLGDHLSFNVQDYLGLHPDIFELPGRGAYINNNPGASILAAIPYAIARPVIDSVTNRVLQTRQASGQAPPEYQSVYPLAREFYRQAFLRGLDVKFGLGAAVMQMGLMAPLSAFSVVVMFYIFLALIRSKPNSFALAILYAFATPVFLRSGQLNHNLLQSHFALFAFALLWQPWNEGRPRRISTFFLAGLLAGWTVVLDYSGIILLAAIGMYAVMRWRTYPRSKRRITQLGALVVGAGLSLSILLLYQGLAFGNPFLPAQSYMPQTQYSVYGYQGMDWPKMDLLLENIVGKRYGLLISAPIFLFALYPPGWYNRKIRIIGRIETIFVFVLTVGMFAFTAANQFSRMQFNSGIRHVVPVVPFLFLIVAGVILAMPRWLSIPVSWFCLFWSWCLAMYRDVELGNGVVESFLYVIRNGVVFPWVATLQRLSYLPDWVSPWIVFLFSVFAIAAIWLTRWPAARQPNPSPSTQ